MGFSKCHIKGWIAMNICDLGEIQGDMLLFGGIYSNLAALNAFISIAQENSIPPQNCICTGDIVAYCADAAACVDLMRDFTCPVIAGNCEVQLANDAQDCGCGFSEGSECSILSDGWYNHAIRQINDTHKQWMSNLPDRITFVHNTKRYGVVHGAASDISRFIWPVASDDVILSEIALLESQIGKVDVVIAGHTGIPMSRSTGATSWVNTGAIGMPSHNGSTLTHFGHLSGNKINIKDLSYDANATVLAMQQAGLTQGYEKALSTGYWPSEDNLPAELHR